MRKGNNGNQIIVYKSVMNSGREASYGRLSIKMLRTVAASLLPYYPSKTQFCKTEEINQIEE